MPATNQDITHWAGNTATIRIQVEDSSGAKVDLTGATARWWMGKNPKATGADIYIEKSTTSGITVDFETDYDYLVVTLARADTKALTPGTFYHEAEIVNTSNAVATVTTGKFILKPVIITDP